MNEPMTIVLSHHKTGMSVALALVDLSPFEYNNKWNNYSTRNEQLIKHKLDVYIGVGERERESK